MVGIVCIFVVWLLLDMVVEIGVVDGEVVMVSMLCGLIILLCSVIDMFDCVVWFLLNLVGLMVY